MIWIVLPLYVPVRMAVCPRWLAVSGPSGVCDAGVGVEDLGQVRLGLLDERLQLSDLANLLERQDFTLLVTVYRETGRVVATVLESREACSNCQLTARVYSENLDNAHH